MNTTILWIFSLKFNVFEIQVRGDKMLSNMSFIWLSIVIVLTILELITTQLVSIWFVVAGIIAFIVSLFIDSIFIQIAVFVVLTVLLLIVTKPMVKRIMDFKKVSTNSDRNIGKRALVVAEINNKKETGEVKVYSMIWTARSIDDTIIPENSEVIIESIKGVKLIVKKV